MDVFQYLATPRLNGESRVISPPFCLDVSFFGLSSKGCLRQSHALVLA
jgi:hypothetical protein